MIKITFPDDSSREYKKGITAIDIAKDISPGFAKNVLSANFEGEIIESSTEIYENGIKEYTEGMLGGIKLSMP